MRGSNLVKFLRTVDLLSRPQGATVDEIVEELGIDKRSVYRLLEVISDMHFPIYDEPDPEDRRRVRKRLVDTYQKKLPNMTVPEINLSVSELIALYLLRGEERIYKGTEVEKKIDSAFAKIAFFMPPNLPFQLDKLRPLFLSARKLAKDYKDKEEIIDLLTDAMLQNLTCYVQYHSFADDEVKSFRIDPLHLFENQGGLYLFVNATKFGDIRILAVERIEKLSITEDKFVYPENFNPEERLESAFNISMDDEIACKIWFSPSQARYIAERKWSPNQKIKNETDGSIILSMTTSGLWDVKRWIMMYGADAEVLEPEELRQAIVADLAAMQERYFG
ncbi:MAG: WYL domain-containing protein [Desulforudis sp.]|jgi:predicted DNA-binding transcriptional regulator YafY|nr:MAG: WYL domain-containing protein [Desulforudis sp.]